MKNHTRQEPPPNARIVQAVAEVGGRPLFAFCEVETSSPYARQFLDRLDRPQVDGIEGIPPAIAIDCSPCAGGQIR